MKIKNLLITAIGGNVAQSVANIIKEKRPSIRLIGTDITDRHAGELFVDNYIKIVKATDKSYMNTIRGIIKKYNIDAILPISEAELEIFSNFGTRKIDNCYIIHCGEKALRIGLDKLETSYFLRSINEMHPWTTIAEETHSVEIPCILKPRISCGSKNIYFVEDSLDFNYLKRKYPHYIFQELLSPKNQEITCAVYRTKSSKTYVLQMLRRLSGGTTSWASIVNHRIINELCIKISQELELSGNSINIQMIMTKNGPYIFEINPRFSSTAQMRDKVGFSDVIWTLDEIENKEIKIPKINNNKTMLKIDQVLLAPKYLEK